MCENPCGCRYLTGWLSPAAANPHTSPQLHQQVPGVPLPMIHRRLDIQPTELSHLRPHRFMHTIHDYFHTCSQVNIFFSSGFLGGLKVSGRHTWQMNNWFSQTQNINSPIKQICAQPNYDPYYFERNYLLRSYWLEGRKANK